MTEVISFESYINRTGSPHKPKNDIPARDSSLIHHLNEQVMQLHLSGTSPINSTYHTADGQTLYKVRTSPRVFEKITTIYCIVPNNEDTSPKGNSHPDQMMRDVFGCMAKYEWNVFHSSRLRFRGEEFRTRSFFKKQGWGWYGPHRVFNASNGREYKWKLRARGSELTLNDETQTPVARYHPGRKWFFSEPRMPVLDIYRSGEHIIDTIVVTLVYIEKLREDQSKMK